MTLTPTNVQEYSSQSLYPNPPPNPDPIQREEIFAEETNQTITIPSSIDANIRPYKFRTVAEVVRVRTINLPEDFPSGPWTSTDTAKQELSSWAHNLLTGGGRFSLNWGANLVRTSKKSRQKILNYHRSRKAKLTGEGRYTSSFKCNCPFFAYIEECSDGWVIARGNFQHNHALHQTTGSSLAEVPLRSIPKEMLKLGETLKSAVFTASKISQALESEAYRLELPVSWAYQDVYNSFSPSTEETSSDTTNFIEYLRKRYVDNDLYYSATTDPDGCLDKVFWEMKNGLERWAEDCENNPAFLTHHMVQTNIA